MSMMMMMQKSLLASCRADVPWSSVRSGLGPVFAYPFETKLLLGLNDRDQYCKLFGQKGVSSFHRRLAGALARVRKEGKVPAQTSTPA
jgi:hypothetical protein